MLKALLGGMAGGAGGFGGAGGAGGLSGFLQNKYNQKANKLGGIAQGQLPGIERIANRWSTIQKQKYIEEQLKKHPEYSKDPTKMKQLLEFAIKKYQ